MKKLIIKIKKFLSQLFRDKAKDVEIIIPQEFRSHEFEKKLALIIKDTDSVDNNDLKYVVCRKLDTSKNNDLFSAYRLDFHTRAALDLFKKKYKSLIL
jgi:hypothetical protein